MTFQDLLKDKELCVFTDIEAVLFTYDYKFGAKTTVEDAEAVWKWCEDGAILRDKDSRTTLISLPELEYYQAATHKQLKRFSPDIYIDDPEHIELEEKRWNSVPKCFKSFIEVAMSKNIRLLVVRY